MPSSVFEVTDESLAQEPVKLVRFSHGHLRSDESHKLTWNMFKRKKAATFKSKGADKQIVTASVNGMTYSGQNFGPQAVNASDVCNYYIAVHNKSTNKVRVLPAELYRLEPKIKEEINNVETGETDTFKDKNFALAKEFGSGRSQRAVMRREQNQLDQNMVSTATQKVADSAHTKEQTESASTVTDRAEVSAVPPHNKDAKTPGEVYKLKDIIKEDIMPSLKSMSEVFVNCTKEDIQNWCSEKTYPNYILGKLETLAVREDARLFQSQCLMFLHCLIKAFNMKNPEIRRKYPFPQDWPEPVKKSILDTFTYDSKGKDGRKQRCMPGHLKDLLLSHILVLCLKLNGFQLELNPLIADLNIAQKKLSTHASALGCSVRVVRDKQDKSSIPVYIAELKVPLKFPEMRGKSNKKRIF